MAPPAAQPVRLAPDEAADQSNLEALAQLKPDVRAAAVDHPTLRIKRGRRTLVRRLTRAEIQVPVAAARLERAAGKPVAHITLSTFGPGC